MIILVMGLSGSGKTTLARRLAQDIGCTHINADEVRGSSKDWDFSLAGRERQARRLNILASDLKNKGVCAVVDFICPTNKLQQMFKADYVIWMDTVKSSKYLDTDAIFEAPPHYNYKVSSWGTPYLKDILEGIL
jgi:adenylylsulfate kinase